MLICIYTTSEIGNSVCVFQALMGQAVDRHLLGLMMLAREAGMDVPEIFTDVGYTRSTHFCLSTSQVG